MAFFTDISFLCSYFSYDPHLDINGILSVAGWNHKEFKEQLRRDYKNYFYPEFVDYSLGNPSEDGGVSVYSKDVDASVAVHGIAVTIKDIRIHVMPYGMVIFAINLEMESDDPNDFTFALCCMREKSKWKSSELQEFHEKGIRPVKEAARLLGCEAGDIIEMGNKLKVFQIVNTEDRKNYGENMDYTLFELGTLGKIGGCTANDPNSPSKTYIERILKDNRLSFYNNWNGLALFDTFTIMAYKATSWMLDTWISDYFSMIYIHNLFLKFYLFRLNYRFRTHPEDGKVLENEYNEFERLYSFNKISYNFLPGEVNKAMDRGLEISEEKKLIAHFISSYNKEKDEEESRRFDRILTFLAVVTVFSTIWDFSCMLNAMWPFENFSFSVAAGFRTIVLMTLLAVILVIIAIIKKPERFK